MTSGIASAPAAAPVGGFGAPCPVLFVDGEFVAADVARVSAHANVLSYGIGTFEGIRASWNDDHEQLYLLEPDAHYARMHRSARVLGLELPYGTNELIEISAELLRRNEVRSDAYLRPLYILAGDELPVRVHGAPARGVARRTTSRRAAPSSAAATWDRHSPRARRSLAATTRL
jgi:branched-chain amino acid aminotransferase